MILRCSECGLPWGRVENGVLIVESRHHGETHVNVIPVADLARLAEANAEGWPPQMEQKTDTSLK